MIETDNQLNINKTADWSKNSQTCKQNFIMEIEKIRAKIVAKQEMINLEKDQTRKNELMQDLNVLKMRLDMEKTHDNIKKLSKTN